MSERIGENNFSSGLRLVTFEQNRYRVIAKFRSASSRTLLDDADILVGADGIHSTVRHQLYPNEGEPRFARQLMWRAAIDAETFLDGRTMVVAGHFEKRIIAYPIGRSRETRAIADQLGLPNGRDGRNAAARGLESPDPKRARVDGLR